MTERATTDVFVEDSSDLICCRECDWYVSRVKALEKLEAEMKRVHLKRHPNPPYPDPSFYCDSYKRCWKAILTGASDMTKKLIEMGVVNEISEGPSHVAAIVGEW